MDDTAEPRDATPTPDPGAAPGDLGGLLTLIRSRGYERRAEPFQLSSGGHSHDYVDLRRAVARGADLAVAARAVLAHLDAADVTFEAIGGMTMGADPVAHAVALIGGLEWFSVRKALKGHGRQQRVEGASLSDSKPIVLFEDTVSTGGSIFEAYEVLATTGATVVAACTLLDRGDTAAPRFAALGVEYFPLLTYQDLGIEPIVPVTPDQGDAPAPGDTSAG
jgi:orotate phosphoribosyltransferase